MALDREPVRLVAYLLQQVEPRVVGSQVQDTIAVGKYDVFLARLALGSLGDADQPRVVQPLFREHLGRDRDLPLAAVDHEQIGRRELAGDDRAQRRASASASRRNRRRLPAASR